MNRKDSRYLRALTGVPVLPPAPVTRLVTRARTGLGRARRSAGPPPVRILEALFGLFDNRVLGLLVELGVPERLDRPATVEELAAGTATAVEPLDRVLRYAAGRGFLRRDRKGRYRANGVTAALRADHANSWRGWVEFAGSDWFWAAWRRLDAPVRGEGSGLEAATGHPFFEFVQRVRPDAGVTFDEAMRAGSALQAVALDHALGWDRVARVCDVGGGTGAALEYLLDRHRHLHGTLVDLPEVLSRVQARLASGDLAGRCTIQPGSFFDELPAGCDRYLLLAVVHDWDDDEAAALLRRVGEALPAGGEALVVENVLPERPRDEFVAASDLLMLVLASGRERTLAQFEALFARSGLRLDRRIALASGFTAFSLQRP